MLRTSRRALSTGLVTFGEALMTFKPRPPAAGSPLPNLAPPACEVVQSIGGAELNVAVAHTLAGGKAKWVSSLPAGALGDHVLKAASDAGVDTSGVVRDATPHAMLGTLHVVDEGQGPRPHFQRHGSSFCTTLGAGSFDWASILAPARWLTVTGITPALGAGPKAAWLAAIDAAAASSGAKCHVGLDLNWRPALGTFEELWDVVQPCVAAGKVSLLMLSADSMKALAIKEGVWTGDGAAGDPDKTYEAMRAALTSLRAKWNVPLLACGFKRPRIATAAAPLDGKNKDTLAGAATGGVVRWSVIATPAGEVSTQATPTIHRPVEALGGGDAWMGGFTLKLLEAGLDAKIAAGDFPLDALRECCRRGDLLAAMTMARYGDLGDVKGADLRAIEARFAGTTALLDGLDLEAGQAVLDRLRACKIVPVVGIDDPADAEPIARALLAGGIDVMELVLRTPQAEESLKVIADKVEGMCVGAGTVLSTEQAERAVAKGAQFLVSPGSNPKVINWCTARGVPVVPGIATATELEASMDLGLKYLKFFPAEANGGVKTLKALSGPYGPTGVQFMPTGGLTTSNINDYLSLPTVFCAGGTWLVPAKAVADKDFKQIEVLAREAVKVAS